MQLELRKKTNVLQRHSIIGGGNMLEETELALSEFMAFMTENSAEIANQISTLKISILVLTGIIIAAVVVGLFFKVALSG